MRGLLVALYAVVTRRHRGRRRPRLGREIFPASGAHQFQLRFRAPAGTKFESTERLAGDGARRDARGRRRRKRGDHARLRRRPALVVSRSTRSFCGRADRTKACCRWRSGQDAPASGSRRSKSDLRDRFAERFPRRSSPSSRATSSAAFSTSARRRRSRWPIAGPDFAATRAFATRGARRAGEDSDAARPRSSSRRSTIRPSTSTSIDSSPDSSGVTVDQIGRSFAAATSSSRFVAPNYWADPRTGIAFQVQVEVPQPRMTTLDDLRVVPVTAEGASHPLLGDVARIENGTIVGEYDRFNGQRMVTLSANVAGEDLGRVAVRVDEAIARAGAPPRGASVAVRGQIAPMRDTLRNIGAGLLAAVVVIFLLLAANFQSVRLAFAVISTVPAVLAGVVLMLLATQDHAQRAVVHGRHHGDRRRRRERHPAGDVRRAGAPGGRRAAGDRRGPGAHAARADDERRDDRGHAADGACDRRRSGGAAPLGRAVIGGLAAATLATLFVLPSVYSLAQPAGRSSRPGSRRSPKRTSDMKHPLCWIGVVTSSAICIAACSGGGPPGATTPAARTNAPVTIEVADVVAKPIDVTLSMPGQLDPYETVAVYPRVSGFVKSIGVDRGSHVQSRCGHGRARSAGAVCAACGGAVEGAGGQRAACRHTREGRCGREHVRQAQRSGSDAGSRRRQRPHRGAEAGRSRSRADCRGGAERGSRATGAAVRRGHRGLPEGGRAL